MSELICVGSIAGAFGVKGELRIKSFCANPSDLAEYSPLVSEDGERSFQLSLIGQIKNGFSGRIVGVVTKEDADALNGVHLYAQRDQLPDLSDEEYYYSDLIGMAVSDTGGVAIGTVKTVANHGADDLLEVTLMGSSNTAFIPFTREIVPTVDVASGRIVIDPPEGML